MKMKKAKAHLDIAGFCDLKITKLRPRWWEATIRKKGYEYHITTNSTTRKGVLLGIVQ